MARAMPGATRALLKHCDVLPQVKSLMHIYDISTPRRKVWSVKLNWSRELTVSKRQVNYIMARVPDERAAYCIAEVKSYTSAADNFIKVGDGKWDRVSQAESSHRSHC